MAARRTDASYIVEAVARRNREIKATIPRDPSPSLLPLFLPFSSKQSPPDLIFSIKTPPLHEISTKRNETKFSKLLPNFFRLSIVKTQTSPPTMKYRPIKSRRRGGCERLSKVTRPTRPFDEGRRKRCLVQRTGIPKFPLRYRCFSLSLSLSRSRNCLVRSIERNLIPIASG